MDSLVLLSVLVITQTIVSARPANMDFKTKRSVDADSGEIFKPEFIEFPTKIRHGFIVTINGTLDPTNKKFEVVFLAGKQKEDLCSITYDFESRNLDVFPPPQDEDNLYKFESYENFDNLGEYPTFSIKVIARSIMHPNTRRMLKLTFEVNGRESKMATCPIESFDDLGYIEFRNGVHSITSLLFEF